MYLLSIKLTEEREKNEYERELNEVCARDYSENVKRFLNIRYNMNANKETSV